MVKKGEKNPGFGPPIGNQYAVGKGRPLKKGYSEEEVIALGEELFKWMDLVDFKKTPVVHLSEWYSHIKHINARDWDVLQKRICFFPYYDRAIRWMGNKMLLNKNFQVAYGSRFLGIYFKDIREHEKDIMKEKLSYEKAKLDYEYALKAQADLKQLNPPSEPIITSDDENIRLKYEIMKLKEQILENTINADQRKTD